MPSRPTGGSSSEADSDVPESFSLAESKKSAKRKNEEIQRAHTAIKRQGKLKNQERDRTLKEQAKRRPGKESVNKEREDVAVDTPEARMERAMMEAQEEGSGGGDSEGGEQDGFSGLGVEDEIASEEEDMESGESSADGMDVEIEEIPAKKPKHLPDHLFEVAFASQNAQLAEASNSPIPTSRKSKEAALSSKKKKRKEQFKDMVIGYDYFPPVPSAHFDYTAVEDHGRSERSHRHCKLQEKARMRLCRKPKDILIDHSLSKAATQEREDGNANQVCTCPDFSDHIFIGFD
jgi:hypothetical protein